MPNPSLTTCRRQFLKACSALALCVGCSPLLSRPRLLLIDPSPEDYGPILLSLITTILPFEHPRFPKLAPAQVEKRLAKLFPLEEEKEWAALRKSLLFFDDITLFPHAFGPIRDEERKNLRGDRTLTTADLDRLLEEKSLAEENAFAAFRQAGHGGTGSFAGLNPSGRMTYLDLWSQSEFLLKRRFYRSVKALVMISVFSTPEMWERIGYAGPMLPPS